VIELDGRPDLILTGKQSVDSEGMQTQYRLAAALDMPVANDVASLALENGRALVECELGGGRSAVVELSLPCVIGATKGLNVPRYPKLPEVLKAKKKPVKEINLADLDANAPKYTTEIIKLDASAVRDKRQVRLFDGSIRESVVELVRLLREEEKVI
jgi:electron transfer flavoprotein beta subunit